MRSQRNAVLTVVVSVPVLLTLSTTTGHTQGASRSGHSVRESEPYFREARAAGDDAPSGMSAGELVTELARGREAIWELTALEARPGPRPLVERPTTSTEYARPHRAPLEETFLDARMVRHELGPAPVTPSGECR